MINNIPVRVIYDNLIILTRCFFWRFTGRSFRFALFIRHLGRRVRPCFSQAWHGRAGWVKWGVSDVNDLGRLPRRRLLLAHSPLHPRNSRLEQVFPNRRIVLQTRIMRVPPFSVVSSRTFAGILRDWYEEISVQSWHKLLVTGRSFLSSLFLPCLWTLLETLYRVYSHANKRTCSFR